MSERRPVLGVLCVLLLAAARVEGQDRSALSAEIARWEGRVDSLRVAQRGAILLDSATTPGPRAAPQVEDLELVEVGGYRIRTNHSPLPLRAAATEAWSLLTGYFGDAMKSFVPRPLVVQGIAPDTNAGELDGVADLTLHWDVPPVTLVYALLDAGRMPAVDSGLLRWLGAAPHPDLSPDDGLAMGYEQLALSPFGRGHACIGGEIGACRIALALEPVEATLATNYPDAVDRRRAVQVLARRQQPADQVAAMIPCVSGGDDDACTAILRETDRANLPELTDRHSRGPLLALALRTGGPAAFQRLVASAGRPIAARLEATADLPLDSLLGSWVVEMSRARHAAEPWSSRVGFAGLGWAGLLALCALWSSRWRAD